MIYNTFITLKGLDTQRILLAMIYNTFITLKGLDTQRILLAIIIFAD